MICMANMLCLVTLLAASGFGPSEPEYTLKNNVVEVTLSSFGALHTVADLRAQPTTVNHTFKTPADGMDWRVTLSDYNATTNLVALSSAGCKAPPTVNTTGLPSFISFSFNCDPSAIENTAAAAASPSLLASSKWNVVVEYSLPAGSSSATKQLKVGLASADTWAATIRSVEIFRGMPLGAAYTGWLAVETQVSDFHPGKAGQKTQYPLFGAPASEIAGFFRTTGSAGVFASVQNPIGRHTSNNGTNNKCAAGTICPANGVGASIGASSAGALGGGGGGGGGGFDVKIGFACGNTDNKYKFIGSDAGTLELCQAACAADPVCVQFELNVDSTKTKHWCALFNATSTPIGNPKYDCGCRGTCPSRPSPPPPSPNPPPSPHPPPSPPSPANNTIVSDVWAWYEPMFLQTKSHDALYAGEPASFGVTRLQQYNTDSKSGINLGEYKAFTAAVKQTLLDFELNADRGVVRVQVGWDSNDYQIDVGSDDGATEYKRMLDRDGSLGITHAICAPRNTKLSDWHNHTDAWVWEETLFFGLGEKMRTGEWLPSRDPVPESLANLLAYAAKQDVKLLAYVYPVLPFVAEGAEPRNGKGWLYDGRRDGRTGGYQPGNNPQNSTNCTQPGTVTTLPCSDTRASLANVAWQKYFATMMIDFVTKTGAGGFTFDYTSFNDWRQMTDYAEWRGWMKILETLRRAHPEIVIDHRQQSHTWGPWSHASVSYTEPIAGDENPESYGASGFAGAVPSLSTDFVLANNLRGVNYAYRNLQLEPAERIPGFWSHQSERHFDDGVGPGINGNDVANFSAIHQRDFDINGYRFGLLSSVGTAGLNNVAAMLPARDIAENQAFSAMPDVAWIQKWQTNFTKQYSDLLRNTISIATLDRGVESGGGHPRLGFIDGTASFAEDDSEGILFLFNPGARPASGWLTLDESMGISNASASSGTWLAHEIYPREEEAVAGSSSTMTQTPIGLWSHGVGVEIYVPPASAMVLRLRKQPQGAPPLKASTAATHNDAFTTTTTTTTTLVVKGAKAAAAVIAASQPSTAAPLPLVLNLTYAHAEAIVVPTGNAGKFRVSVNITGAIGLVGETARFEVIAATPDPKKYQLHGIYVNGKLAYVLPGYGYNDQCTTSTPTNSSCVVATITFGGGSSKLRASKEATLTSPDPTATDMRPAWFNATLDVDQALLDQLKRTQAAYPVPWVPGDMNAPWLGNRLLLYVYVTQPDVNLTRPRIFINGAEQKASPSFNSRGNTAGRNAGSCFLGYYFDASSLKAGEYDLSVWLPKLNGTSRLIGTFWSGIKDERTSIVVGPTAPKGDLEECASDATGHAYAYTPQKLPTTNGKDAEGKVGDSKNKNVLYLVVDDLRPQLGAYGQKQTLTPNVDAFAQTATVFDNAYCNVAVCSPSRNSFLSGRWPRSSHIYNFVNHVRQAMCPNVVGGTRWVGDGYRNVSVAKTEGAAGQCCTECTNDPACNAWTYVGASYVDGVTVGATAGEQPAITLGASKVKDHCTLFGASAGAGVGAGAGQARAPAGPGVVSGTSGKFEFNDGLISLPQQFKQSGYLTLQTGKIWHTEEGNPTGTGMPPRQDYPRSFSEGCSMADVNDVAEMWGCDNVPGTQGCPLDTDADGNPSDPDAFAPLCDKTIGDDAIAKLEVAAKHQSDTGRPFFLAVGFRKPHMPWRFPKHFLEQYPDSTQIAIAAHPTLDESVPSIAHHTPDLGSMGGGDPYHALNKSYAQKDRLFYYGSASWTDANIGRVLDKLDALALAPSTLVVFHSDHGWALGEHGQWQKFNNWEVGARVPLMIRAPWLKSSAGKRSSTLAELVDIFPTMLELTGIQSLAPAGQLDGTSLGWVLKGSSKGGGGGVTQGKAAVLTQFARCPLNATTSEWITDTTQMWQNNWCEFVDRSEIPWMGYSLRTTNWRYTEWAGWNGTTLTPIWTSLAGVELYDHRNETANNDFDATENENLANVAAWKSTVEELSKQLHTLVAATPGRI